MNYQAIPEEEIRVHGIRKRRIHPVYRFPSVASCIKNPIDEMIERVLENGGDVELVSNGLLEEYCQIALIKD